MKHVFIINPFSGNKNAVDFIKPKIRTAAARLGVQVEILTTQYPGHGTQLAMEWGNWAVDHEEVVRLYSCGGDGSLNEVLSGVIGCQWAEVACVPCGSGNDFVRNFGKKEDFLNIASLMEGEARKIDMIQSNVGWAATICAAGIDAKVAYGIPKYRRLPFCDGTVAYYLSIAEQLFKKMGTRLEIQLEGETIQEHCLLVALCNGGYYGGGFHAAPESDLEDGLMDVIIVKKISRLRIAKVLDLYKKGLHLQDGQVPPELADIVQFRRCKSARIRVLDEEPAILTLDGECTPAKLLEARVIDKCVNIVLPKHLG